ncbi:flagellar basal body L-ring protein FlgH [Nevskia soli]|uniref:flagellar basal body L-ring protein FlgH n=1 Tax=Nevskia soli TaxID=418856 RepID=UPI0004A760E1|nr:flagellar basal body L-ring protein FlgH [Nevskia soli]
MIFASAARISILSIFICALSAQAASLYQPTSYQALTSDARSFRVGDALTVLVVETSTAQNQANSAATKETNASANVTNPTKQSTVGLDLKRSFNGQASTARSGTLQAEISVRVQDVASNGDLAVHGTQKITVNGDTQLIAVSGIVRPIDISSDNVVLSTRLTNAEIVYSGKGFTDRNQSESWISRLFGLLGL